jgi:hypothetical protein
MHALDFAGEQHLQAARAAFHIDDVDFEPLLLVKAASLSHPDRKDGHDRSRDADLERDRIGGSGGRRRRAQREREQRNRRDAKPA